MQVALPQNAPSAAIVITGKALPEPAAEQVYAVERLSRREIDGSPSHSIDQLLKEVPGLQLFRRSDSRSGHPTSQGITLRALGGNASSRALLVLDGVPQSDPFGGWVNWPAYDPSMLADVRLVRGGGSVGNGPGALAGTIEMTSRIDPGTNGEVAVGSRNALEASAGTRQALGRGIVAIGGRAERGDGFVPIVAARRGPVDEPARYRDWSARARYIVPVGDALELQANLFAFHDWRTRGTAFSENRTNGTDASVRLVGRGSWQWSALVYWQHRNLMSSFASVNARRLAATRVSLQDSVPSHGIGGSAEVRRSVGNGLELRLGMGARRTIGESRELYNYVAGEPTRRRRAGGESLTVGGFGEASGKVRGIILTAGARIDRWRIARGHLFERTIASDAVLRDDRFEDRQGWLPTARGGAMLPLAAGVKLRSAAYLGWRMPTLNELFRPFRAGADATAANPALKPERLHGAEAGLDLDVGRVRFAGTAFVNRLTNAIGNVTLGVGPGVFPGVGFVGAGGTYRQRQNIDAIHVRGIEASARWSRGPWSLGAGASFTRARVDAPGTDLDGLRPAQTPNFAATLSGGWESRGRGVEAVVRRVGSQFEDDLNSRRLKGATTLDASAWMPVGRRLDLVARGENLFDALVVAGVSNDGAVERATPRTLWIGLRLRT